MFAIESFTAAIISNDYDRAKGMLKIMTPEIKAVAIEVWEQWVPASIREQGVSNAA